MMTFTDQDTPDQSGKTFVVTGANTGIGLAITQVLAARGARVLLACRDAEKAQAAMKAVRQATPSADLGFVPLDQSDLDSVRKAADLICQEHRLDVLINNAGVMTPPLLHTKQGFELQFGVNHLGSFALTSLLLPKLAETLGSRVVVTSSLASRGAEIDWDDLNAQNSYNRFQRYGMSKLANALFFFELDRRLRASNSCVSAVGCHPGFATTDLGRHIWITRVITPIARFFINSAQSGAWPALLAATGPVTPGGYYGPTGFRQLRGPAAEVERGDEATAPEAAQRLWDASIEMTNINPGL